MGVLAALAFLPGMLIYYAFFPSAGQKAKEVALDAWAPVCIQACSNTGFLSTIFIRPSVSGSNMP